ncbi:hypothetical protein BO94DRAFT_464357 [Aspergillus sclerotioniger CBS 115572]|uniref:BTB domain-containing protein n=1 Tax=Aspergillus sclerotioniger CBS 115572 TaxID=1450535 RepID=A0A317WQM0_9EURO|nr:hypothetical protein BO94DRAFT_464357 [Aspergillus sclerotioniger CBS 115572]PWY88804.1 hypothetical protein BO94DRAFT_464357 [Aspergillus sclerotioniger CBS 115572]
MGSEYTPNPQNEGLRSTIENMPIKDPTGSLEMIAQTRQAADMLPDIDESDALYRVILRTGDVVIEYLDPDSDTSTRSEARHRRWRVSSEDLMRSSPYFRALLDPDKFSEGKQLMQQKMMHRDLLAPEPVNGASLDEQSPKMSYLPVVILPSKHFSPRLGLDAIKLFLEILSFKSFDEEQKGSFDAELKFLPVSLIARVLELADAFNSPRVVQESLKRVGYAFGKGKYSYTKFDSALLKLSEDRIRQTIFVARTLDEPNIFRVMTHALIILGSRSWAEGVEPPESPSLHWRYFSGGIEEELYYRRQCILNTISDLQAYFLRVYGALEDPEPPKPFLPRQPLAPATHQPRPFQCRYGFGNSSACDAFHLGQMTRFFSLRTKTIFLGSMLIDSSFAPDSDSDSEPPSEPPKDITAIIASLKQCPDYQIDPNHIGCGVRRRFLPPLDCIERFVGDGRGLLGIDYQTWDSGQTWPLTSTSWANRAIPRARVIDIRISKISAIPVLTRGAARPVFTSQEENARFLFTAKKRNWEA